MGAAARSLGVGGADGALSPTDEEHVEKFSDEKDPDEERAAAGKHCGEELTGGSGRWTWISSTSSSNDTTSSAGGGEYDSASSSTNGEHGGSDSVRRGAGCGSGSDGGATRHESVKSVASASASMPRRRGSMGGGIVSPRMAGVMGEEGMPRPTNATSSTPAMDSAGMAIVQRRRCCPRVLRGFETGANGNGGVLRGCTGRCGRSRPLQAHHQPGYTLSGRRGLPKKDKRPARVGQPLATGCLSVMTTGHGRAARALQAVA